MTLAAVRAKGELRWGGDSQGGAPYVFQDPMDPNHLIGFEVDLAYALCAAMKTECEVINQPWDALLPGLQVRKYDAIMSSMNITDERRQKVAFSQVYYMMQNRFVGDHLLYGFDDGAPDDGCGADPAGTS